MVKSRDPLRVFVSTCPWTSWSLYFPTEEYDPDGPHVNLVAPLITYFRQYSPLFSKEEIDIKHSVTVDYAEFSLNCQIPSFPAFLRETPARILTVVELAVYEVVKALMSEGWGAADPTQLASGPAATPGAGGGAPAGEPLPRLSVCLTNYEPLTPLKELKANLMGKFIGIRGTVVRVSSIKPNVVQACFTCVNCQGQQVLRFADGKYAQPTKCTSGQCKGRQFQLDRSSPLTLTQDWQKLRVQEIVNDDKNDSGRIPRCVEVELVNHLVDSCSPGDIVHVAGIVKVVTTDEGKGKSANSKTMFLLYVDANSISNCKSRATQDENAEILQFSLKDFYAIREIATQRNLFRLVVNSISPAIYGHEIVKAGLALALFGGRRRYANDKNKIAVRGDPHVLVVGDPGMGKSQMLQAVASIAPRGVYVCGNTTSTAGLTVTLQKDSSGDYALEAGALILGDQGCCCIDEFDKMGAEHQALLEAMEQQSISIAKAGICCSLPARTSVLAAANPVGGHYNKAKTVSENLKMSSALLSRFDLIFILVDKPDQEMDHFLSEHVMALHSGKGALKNFRERGYDQNAYDDETNIPLVERLKMNSSDNMEPIPPVLLRKYIGYARKWVEPVLPPQAAKILQAFYLDLRKKYRSVDSTPITTRQLESMVRLAEARARLEMREKVTEEDAKDVVEIMKYSLYETCEDEFGNLDFQRSQHGTGMSKGGEAKRFVAELQALAERTFNNLFTTQQLYQLGKDMHLRVTNFEDFIDSLNNHGYLLKRGNQVYKLLTSSMM